MCSVLYSIIILWAIPRFGKIRVFSSLACTVTLCNQIKLGYITQSSR